MAEAESNLWETVLREVGTTKAVAQKRILVLGDAGSGKTAVVKQLQQAAQGSETDIDEVSEHDMGLTYRYMDVDDEDGEETIARVGLYQLASDRSADCGLLRLVLDAQTFGATAAVIVLDWARPWRFIKSLLRWMHVLSTSVEDVGSSWAGRAAVAEGRERLERFWQEYSDNGTRPSGVDVLLPLGSGVLEGNLGLPLVVVCTKADAMGVLERERGFSEEDFDYIQQVLRAVCLRLGAALVYTSTHNPNTFATLYQYLVHRLLTTPTTLPPEDASLEATEYPFRGTANVVDREEVFVPAGWDSVAKIGFLREPFDVASMQTAWMTDETRYRAIVEQATKGARADEIEDTASLLLMFGAAVAAPSQRAGLDADGSAVAAATAAAAGMANEVAVEDDQTFFERLYEEQQAQIELEGDEVPDAHNARTGGSSNRFVSSLLRSVHTAESSLSTAGHLHDAGALSDDGEEHDSADAAGTGSLGRAATAHVSGKPQQSLDPSSLRRKLATSSTSESSSKPNEELTSFFQNLLGRKGGATPNSSTSKGSPQMPARSLTGSRTSSKDIHADLERWKAQLKRQKD
ncbi:hypothetical protein LPJ78_005592 [Coemansia sp. RSA 989]|nr:dynein light intermediate chain-domain-containing protein [Coemansia mojavensis]KAJ1742680.1 hypothetical protein LPJ68_001651 [Coemansia sp. RSA 1086]KAJ1752491.1 hypothetical protein LPJ79_001238 [Coemansia sp. RSA 1821]KAJ1860977.1 hypothetical protein LPJ78_005592 [Coemansia sp. RSA 989]KAJ1874521.1 hypothetical protein LPJ55_001381 [Coemansia sp. RSA 990]KAJ2630357.1 hypothetical protein H4R22_002718 [Coemansia sp. RSA 1290]KAJ2648634.1 hypothetical protein IWW40_003820 [Coemansia sp.